MTADRTRHGASASGVTWGAPDLEARVLESAGQAVIATDLNGRVLYWNPAATELYGWSGAEAVGRPVAELVGHANDVQLADMVTTALAGGAWTGEIIVRHREGRPFPLAL